MRAQGVIAPSYILNGGSEPTWTAWAEIYRSQQLGPGGQDWWDQ
jgi:hypothetical protein